MSETEALASNRLWRLLREQEEGRRGALEHFWREVEEMGTPLVERIDGEEDECLVTFLWRDDGSLDNVAVITRWLSREALALPMRHLVGTDVWYLSLRERSDMRGSYHLSPNDPLLLWSQIPDDAISALGQSWRPDPYNRTALPLAWDQNDENPQILTASTFALPDAPVQPWSCPRTHIHAGQVDKHRFRSNALSNERSVWVYTPPGYTQNADPYPLLVLFDGLTHLYSVPVPAILDNLLADERIPPTVAVLVGNVHGTSRRDELACNATFADALALELLPWVRARYRITDDPQRTAVAGESLGGLASAFAAFQHPEVFGLVLSQSGSYWWRPPDDREWEWLARQYAQSRTLPLRFYLNIGIRESEPWTTWPKDRPTMLMCNRHMRTVLTARDYPVQYVEFAGGHDYVCWSGGLAEGLSPLLTR